MTEKSDFATLFEAAAKNSGQLRKLRAGDVVEGRVVLIGADTVFLDVGMPVEGRVDRAELLDAEGKLTVKLGDPVRATVLDPRSDGPVLVIALGRGAELDAHALRDAYQAGAAVSGRVTQVVKGGLEVQLSRVRAFCPASQIDTSFTSDLEPYLGRVFDFKILEFRDGGRSIVVSRRKLLEGELQRNQAELLAKLAPGAELDGVVSGTNKHGALIDLGGSVVAFAHVSELANHRVDRPEDAVTVGDRVRVRVLSVEQPEKGPNVRVSIKAAQHVAHPPEKDLGEQVLEARVLRAVGGGLIVRTALGDAFLPLQEIELAPGADHRRAFPPGRELPVVVLRREATGKLVCSALAVAAVAERQNYLEFSAGASPAGSGQSLGSLGDALRDKLKMPAPKAPSSIRRSRR
ncbi:MAG TPA: S1 RNA-binding domain-containing protein [Polyangiaceae bacterium]|jgi:small subunit ribosomal protein S1